MTDRNDPQKIAAALLIFLGTEGSSMSEAQQALRLALEALKQAEGLLTGTCEHEECKQLREQLRKAEN